MCASDEAQSGWRAWEGLREGLRDKARGAIRPQLRMRLEKQDRDVPRLVLSHTLWEACAPARYALTAFLGIGHGVRDAHDIAVTHQPTRGVRATDAPKAAPRHEGCSGLDPFTQRS